MKEYILISGATSAIGQKVAESLSVQYNLILHGRNEKKLKEIADLYSVNTSILTWKFDLNNVNLIEPELTAFINQHSVVVSSLVHCAGVLNMMPVKMTTPELLNYTMNVNFFSFTQLIKTLINRKVNNSKLRAVVVISSTASKFGVKALSMYSASKGALDAYLRCLAVELAPDVRLNSILPGPIHSEMTERIFIDQEFANKMESTYPLGFGKAADIANLVEFLISDRSSWMTGQQVIIDGGKSINISG